MQWNRVFTGPTLAALALLGAGAVGLLAAVQGLGLTLMKRPAPPARPIYLLSENLGAYHTTESLRLSGALADELGTDRYAFRTYRRPDDETSAVRLLLAYQTGEPDAVPHVPRRLFALGGARGDIVDQRRFDLPGHRLGTSARRKLAAPIEGDEDGNADAGDANGSGGDTAAADLRVPIALMRARSPDGSGRPALGGVLFIVNGRLTADPAEVQRRVSDLRTRRAYWCRIELVPGGSRNERTRGPEAIEAAGAAVECFLRDALPDIIDMLPDRDASRAAR
jgi:hypothetical protein